VVGGDRRGEAVGPGFPFDDAKRCGDLTVEVAEFLSHLSRSGPYASAPSASPSNRWNTAECRNVVGLVMSCPIQVPPACCQYVLALNGVSASDIA